MIPSIERTLPGEIIGKEIVMEMKTLPKSRLKFDKKPEKCYTACI